MMITKGLVLKYINIITYVCMFTIVEIKYIKYLNVSVCLVDRNKTQSPNLHDLKFLVIDDIDIVGGE